MSSAPVFPARAATPATDAAAYPGDSASHREALRQRIDAELTDQWMLDTPKRIPMIVVAALAVCALFWTQMPKLWLVCWLALVVLTSAWRYALYLIFVKYRTADQLAKREALVQQARWALMAVGLAWGLCIVMGDFFAASANAQLIVYVISAGMAMLAVSALNLRAGRAMAISIFVPYMLWGLASGDLEKTLLAICCLMYCGLLVVWARRVYDNVVNAMLLRHENEALIARLAPALEAAEKANLEKSRFLAAASHDLRQPMQGLWLFVGNLRQQMGQPQAYKILDHIESSLDAMRSLFDALLNIAQLDAGGTPAKPSAYAIEHSLDRIVSEFSAECDRKMLRLTVRPSKAIVWVDPGMLDRVLLNLVANAVKYTQSGGIVVGCRKRGAQLCVQVWDTGCGIRAEDQESIFNEFVQLNNPERDRNKGLGLGLAIARRLSAAMNAPLAVRSVPDRGSVFSILLPLATNEQASAIMTSHQAGHETAHTATKGGISPLKRMRLAFIDDEPDIVNVVQALCTAWQVEGICASNVQELLQAWQGQPPDFILSDYRLRDGSNGIEVIDALRIHFGQTMPTALEKNPGSKPIAAALLTGDTDAQLVVQAQQKGIGLVFKPISMQSLQQLLMQHWPRSKLQA
jgi:two-component system, sensor histidine kinase